MRTTRCLSHHRHRQTAAGAVILCLLWLGACGPRPRPQTATPVTSGRAPTSIESANSLDASAFDGQPVNRVEELFIGRFPGVQVFNVNGQVQLRIRGASSVNASTEPLILIDGQQLSPGSGGLIGINPRDIAKIEVLKDAVSMAEFGVRGGNGVIKITTKRSK